MLNFYTSFDIILICCDIYNFIKQRHEKSINQYYLRFSKAIFNLDDSSIENWQISNFIRKLQFNSTKYFTSFVDLVNFKNIIVEKVNERFTQIIKLEIERDNKSNNNDDNSFKKRFDDTNNREFKLSKQHISKNSKQKFKYSNQSSSAKKNTFMFE